MTNSRPVLVQSNLVEYFKEPVNAALRNQQGEPDEMIEYYLVQLLADFHKKEHLAVRCPKTGEEEPFAITYLRAMQTHPKERFALLKGLGDRSLYFSGIFTEHLEASAVGLEYFIGMGGKAYTGVANTIGSSNADLEVLFRELSENFSTFMDILSEVSEAVGLRKDSDLLRIYDRWQRTGSGHAARLLVKAGIPLGTPGSSDDPGDMQ